MATFRFDLNQEYGERLESDAAKKRMSIQEYIRYKLFGEVTIFTVDEVINRIQGGDYENKEFTVPDVYTDEEWSQIDRGNAGVLGKNFYNHITEHPELGIRFVPNRTIKRRAVYIYERSDKMYYHTSLLKEELVENIISDCDPDMSDEALKFYRHFFKEYFDETQKLNPYYRGDCINSLGWTFGVNNKEGSFKSYSRSYTRLFAKEEIELFYQFRKMYHSKENFIILPRGLNIWRGEYRKNDNDNNGYGTCDYFDILLGVIRRYYLQEPISTSMRSYVAPYKDWLDSYGCGEPGWRTFIKRNYLMPFVNDEYLVKDIFADNSSYKSPKCNELIGEHHDFDWCLPMCSKNGEEITPQIAKERAINYIKNSLWIWAERAEILLESQRNPN